LLVTCPRTAVALLALAAVPAVASDIDDVVPRTVQVSVAKDHLFMTVRSRATPADLGLGDWSAYDADASGALDDSELKPLLRTIRERELEYLCVAIDGEVLSLRKYDARRLEPSGEAVPLHAPLTVRIEGRRTVDVSVGEHRFVLYDRPDAHDGVVPIRLSLVVGMKLTEAQGARTEVLGERRLETVVTRFAAATWGTFVRER